MSILFLSNEDIKNKEQSKIYDFLVYNEEVISFNFVINIENINLSQYENIFFIIDGIASIDIIKYYNYIPVIIWEPFKQIDVLYDYSYINDYDLNNKLLLVLSDNKHDIIKTIFEDYELYYVYSLKENQYNIINFLYNNYKNKYNPNFINDNVNLITHIGMPKTGSKFMLKYFQKNGITLEKMYIKIVYMDILIQKVHIMIFI